MYSVLYSTVYSTVYSALFSTVYSPVYSPIQYNYVQVKTIAEQRIYLDEASELFTLLTAQWIQALLEVRH